VSAPSSAYTLDFEGDIAPIRCESRNNGNSTDYRAINQPLNPHSVKKMSQDLNPS
jgi:hypothetical protein